MYSFLNSTLLIQVVLVELHTQPKNWTTIKIILWSALWKTPKCTSHHTVILELWCLGHTCKLPLITFDYFWLQLWGSFMPLFKVVVDADMTFLLLSSQHMGHICGRNVTHVQILLQNALNWAQWNFRHVSSFKDSESLFWRISSLTLSAFSSLPYSVLIMV